MASKAKTNSSKRRSLALAVIKDALKYVKQHARKPSWKVYPRRTSSDPAASSNGTLTSETQSERVPTVDVSCERDAEVVKRPDETIESAEPIVEPESCEATEDDAAKIEPRRTLTTSQKRVIQHTIKLLDAYGREIRPGFFENPKEPARYTVDACNDSNWIGYGDISMSPYDTAWVAMVPSEQYKASPTPENFELAFPECFTWLFHSQDADGSWARKGAGSIAPALAGLLALGTFRECAGNLFNQKLAELELSEEKYRQVFDRAVGFLRATLEAWQITDIDMTGFEIIVPYHMRALAKLENPVTFDFPEKENLIKANQDKVNLIPIEKIFELAARRHPVTIIHSIEAFSDIIDLGRCQNEGFQAINGSYGSSAAATAAILIHAPQWDEKAHGFLQKTIARRPPCTQHCGNVPTLSDIGIFETLWVMHSVGEVVAKIMQDESTKEQYPATQELFEKNMAFMDYIEQLLHEQDGILRWVSWDNRIPADIDDTCVSSYLTRQFKPDTPEYLDKIVKMYWAGTHFLTFPLERTWSASCNTHMLNHLLAERARAQAEGRAPLQFTVMTKTGPRKAPIDNIIRLTLKSIVNARNKDHVWLDKWNISPAYTTFKSIDMILSLLEFPDPNLIALTEFGDRSTLLRYCRGSVDWALRSQHSDGTWGEPSDNAEGNVEETSYVVRLLKTARRYWPEDQAIESALRQGREYLLLHLDEAMADPEFLHKRQPFLWINKQLYTVPRIIQASVLCALWDNKAHKTAAFGLGK